VDVDHLQLVGRRLEDVAVVVDLDEFAPVGGRAAGGRDGWWLERFAEMREDFPDRPRLRDERHQPDVAAAVWALKWKLLPHPGQEFRPGNPRGVVRAGLLMCVRAAVCNAPVVRLPTGRGITQLADIPDGERRNRPPQLVIRRESAVIPMPVLPRRRHEIGEPVEELKRREFDDAIGPRSRGLPLAARADPVGGFVSGQHVADFGYPAVWAADHGEPLEREGRPGAVSQQVLEALKIARHITVDERDPDARIDRKPAVLPGEHVGGGRVVDEASEPEPPDHAAAHPLGERGQIGLVDRSGR